MLVIVRRVGGVVWPDACVGGVVRSAICLLLKHLDDGLEIGTLIGESSTTDSSAGGLVTCELVRGGG